MARAGPSAVIHRDGTGRDGRSAVIHRAGPGRAGRPSNKGHRKWRRHLDLHEFIIDIDKQVYENTLDMSDMR